ncbi:MAG: HAMP domain-containing histidine kinase [Clostridioides sp.]|jgi:signal transduction histidine kinase|nr:HAMP domain-containing histidine kinase [Clostridioides sp.]
MSLDNKEISQLKHFLVHTMGAVAMILVVLACLVIGYYISQFILLKFDNPKPLTSHMLSGFIGILIFMLVFKIIISLSVKYFNRPLPLQSELISAIEKVASGNFDVFVPIHGREHPFSEMVESVNKMAKELGTMETLRQEFISNVSHEIQSPLTSISGFASLLRNENINESDRLHYIDIIETESRRLSKLSDNMLKLSKLESEEININASGFRLDRQIQNAVLMLEPQWSKKDIEFDIDIESVDIFADEELLAQVWINLIHNAIKFSNYGGKIRIRLWRIDSAKKTNSHKVEENKKIHLEISDEGVGISDEDRVHVFERFYKADKSRDRSLGGSGLGLSLVKKIVEIHGGEIEVESEVGKGTRFKVLL